MSGEESERTEEIFHVFVLADDIFEKFGIDLGVVSLLLQRHAIHLPCLYAVGNIVRIDLR